MDQGRSHPTPFLVSEEFLRTECRVSLGFVQHLFEIFKRELPNGLRQMTDGTLTDKSFMDLFKGVAQLTSSKQLRLPIIGIPAGMFHPTTQEIILSWHEIGNRPICLILSNNRENFIAGFRRAAFIGIQ